MEIKKMKMIPSLNDVSWAVIGVVNGIKGAVHKVASLCRRDLKPDTPFIEQSFHQQKATIDRSPKVTHPMSDKLVTVIDSDKPLLEAEKPTLNLVDGESLEVISHKFRQVNGKESVTRVQKEVKGSADNQVRVKETQQVAIPGIVWSWCRRKSFVFKFERGPDGTILYKDFEEQRFDEFTRDLKGKDGVVALAHKTGHENTIYDYKGRVDQNQQRRQDQHDRKDEKRESTPNRKKAQ
jgi:hypothetical protein